MGSCWETPTWDMIEDQQNTINRMERRSSTGW